jgi:Mrp family chromosome partitioning ATPase
MNRPSTRLARPRGLLAVHVRVVLAMVLLSVGGAFLVATRQPTEFTSVSRVLLSAAITPSGTPMAPDMGTEREVALSGTIAKIAATRLGLTQKEALRGLSVTAPVDATVLKFGYSSNTPGGAKRGAEAFAQAYVDFRNGAISGTKGARADVITPAAVPRLPDPTNYALILGLAAMLGLLVGVAAAAWWDRFADRLRGPADAAAQTGLKVLGSIPRLDVSALTRSALVGTNHSGHHRGSGGAEPAEEVFGHLVAQLPDVLTARGRVAVLVTGPSVGAGASTTATGIAVALALVGKPVVLVCADLRRPSLHEMFGLSLAPGLDDVLADRVPLERAVRPTGCDGLRVLPAGGRARSGPVHLNLDDLRLVMSRLSSEAIVVVDAPPVVEAAETAQLAETVDQILLVVDIDHGRRRPARAAVESLAHVQHKVVGCVVNRPAPPSADGPRPRRRDYAPDENAPEGSPEDAMPATTDR